MNNKELRNKVQAIVEDAEDGITLDGIYNHFRKEQSRESLRTLCGKMYFEKLISRRRTEKNGRKKTMYYKYDGQKTHVMSKTTKMKVFPAILNQKHFRDERAFF